MIRPTNNKKSRLIMTEGSITHLLILSSTPSQQRQRIFSTFGLSLESHWNVRSLLQNVCRHATADPRTSQFAVTTWRGAETRVMNLALKHTRWEQLFNSFSCDRPPFLSCWLWDKVGRWNRTSARLTAWSERECVCLCVSLQSFWL